MKMQWEEPTKIPEGKLNGEIVRIEYKEEPYRYTDVYIKLDGKKVELKYGYPSNLNPNSKLGRFLIAMGAEYEKQKEVDIEETLLNKRVAFVVVTKTTGDKKFSTIVDYSVRPIVSEENVE